MARIILFTQNTMASIVATREILHRNHASIKAVVLASQLRGSSSIDQMKVAYKLIRKSSWSFFWYKIVESKLYNVLLLAHTFSRSRKFKSEEAANIPQLAKKYSIPIINCNDLSEESFLQEIEKYNPDFVICLVAQILKKKVFDLLGNKLINAHGSYLPRYRGPAQYFWYLLNDDTRYGITVHFMDAGLDSGKIIFQKEFNFNQGISAYRLHYLLARSFGTMLNIFIEDYAHLPELPSVPQDNALATHTTMPTSADMKLFRKKGKRMLTIKDFFHCI